MATIVSNHDPRPQPAAPRFAGRWLDRAAGPLVLVAMLALMGIALSEFAAPPIVPAPAASASA